MKTWSWSNLERSWGGLGKLLGHFGRLRGRPGMLLGRLGELRGHPWGPLGRPKIDQKIDPKLDSKTGRIATEKNGPNTTPVMVSELDQGQRTLDPITQKSYQNRYRYD